MHDLVPLGVVWVDRARAVVGFNTRLAGVIESDPEPLRDHDVAKLLDAGALAAVDSALAGKAARYEGPCEITLSQRSFYLALQAEPLVDDDGVCHGAALFCENITQRIMGENALRSSRHRLAFHVERSPLAVIGWTPNFVVTEWNASAARIFGWSALEAVGQQGLFIVRPEDRPAIASLWTAIVANRGGHRNTNLNITKDGRVIHCEWYNSVIVDADGRVVGVQSLCEDITDRVNAQTQLQRSELRFRDVIEHMPYAVGVTVGGKCVYANPEAVSLYGVSSEAEILGRAVTDFVHPDDVSRVVERRHGLNRGKALLEPEVLRFVRKDGRVLDGEVVSMPIEFGAQPAVLNVITDVTEKRTIQAKLMQTDRMAAMGMLAAGVAHEVNNPLAYMIANLDLLANRKMRAFHHALARAHELAPFEHQAELAACLDALGDCNRMIDMAREGATRVRDIVRDLRSFTRAEDRRVPVDVSRVLRACINLAHDEIASRGKVLVHVPADMPFAFASESRLGQVFLNLLLNAVQALAAGTQGNRIEVRAEAYDDTSIVVHVDDNGAGIPQEVLPRIFEPFFTTKPPGVGTGLGLWICRSIVTAMGGDIRVESRPGRTRFSVTLPTYAGPTSSSRTSHPPAPVLDPGVRRVLVVDDEAAILRVLGDALATEFALTTCESGFEAIEHLQRGARYDAILCDRVMPELTGDDVLDWLRAHDEAMVARFAFMTGGEREKGKIAGVRVIDKPFDLGVVRDLLDELSGPRKS